MRRKWKRVAEFAANPAFQAEEVGQAAGEAIEQDWRKEVPPGLVERVRQILTGPSLFTEDTVSQLQSLRPSTSGHNLGNVLIDCTVQVTIRGKSGEAAFREAATDALADRGARCARQVEEHYLRETSPPRSRNVRARIEKGIRGPALENAVSRILDPSSRSTSRRENQDGLDDGVRL